MGEIRYTEAIEIAAAPEEIFDYRIDFTTLPEYNPTVSNIRRTDGGSVAGAGAEYLFDLSMGGATAEMPIRVTLAERPGRIVFDTGPGYMATEDCTFTPAGPGTRVEFAYTLTFPTEVDDATAQMVEASGREQARTELEHMKKILER
ncbi:MAG: SRPBCC family protein [Actinomycetota bacterium]